MNELSGYSYKKLHTSDGSERYTDDPEKGNDHAIDAMRYAIFTYNKRVNYKIR
jgi:phage terminase large subunit